MWSRQRRQHQAGKGTRSRKRKQAKETTLKQAKPVKAVHAQLASLPCTAWSACKQATQASWSACKQAIKPQASGYGANEASGAVCGWAKTAREPAVIGAPVVVSSGKGCDKEIGQDRPSLTQPSCRVLHAGLVALGALLSGTVHGETHRQLSPPCCKLQFRCLELRRESVHGREVLTGLFAFGGGGKVRKERVTRDCA